MAPPRLHLDADTSLKVLHTTLVDRGHDVTRTPTPWMPRDASDSEQLLGATAQGRVLFTFNVADFPTLVQHYPDHGGLLLAAQRRWTLSDLIAALDRMLSGTQQEEWRGQVRWPNQWR
jgi:hypothetical protein